MEYLEITPQQRKELEQIKVEINQRSLMTLQKMRDLLSEEKSWCQGNLAMDEKGNKVGYNDHRACRWCLMGALHKVKHLQDDKTIDILKDLVFLRDDEDLFKFNHPDEDDDLFNFNDHENTTHQDVLDLIDRAILSVESELGITIDILKDLSLKSELGIKT